MYNVQCHIYSQLHSMNFSTSNLIWKNNLNQIIKDSRLFNKDINNLILKFIKYFKNI